MLTFLYNLFIILRKVPTAIGIVKAILDIVGSETVTQLFAIVHEAVQRVKIENPAPQGLTTAPERQRFLQRLRGRIAQRMLGVSDTEFATIQNVFANTRDSQIA
jgi:hypothetical protein